MARRIKDATDLTRAALLDLSEIRDNVVPLAR